MARRQVDDRWMTHGLCYGNEDLWDVFYPPDRVSGDERRALVARARSICAECPVRPECLEYALAMGDPWGVWGGLPGDERASLPRRASRHAEGLRARPTEALV